MSSLFPNKTSIEWRSVREIGGCLACYKKDWCTFCDFETYRLVACHRQPEGGYKLAANGAGLYRFPLDGGIKIVERKTNIAPIKRRDAVYRELLNRSVASGTTIKKLFERGLSESDIKTLIAFGYKDVDYVWVGTNPQSIANAGYDLSYVPGFYKNDDGCWRGNYHDGFFIPALDMKGRIQALQIRKFEGDPKYVWFSSSKKNGKFLEFGASSGSPIHFRRTRLGTDAKRTVWVTEGLLKGDILWLKKDYNTISIAGVNNGHAKVCQWIIAGGFSKVIIAFDGNWRTNHQVKVQLIKLADIIKNKTGLSPELAIWNDTCGVDDAIIGGIDIELVKELPE